MKLTHSVLTLTLVAGLAGSVAAYRATAGEVEPEPTPPAASAVSAAPARQLVLPGTTFAWAPCEPGARLERGTCVTDVVRTVALPAPLPPASTVRTDDRADGDDRADLDDDEGEDENENEDEGEDESDDDHEGDDDHEDDDHEDDEGDDD